MERGNDMSHDSLFDSRTQQVLVGVVLDSISRKEYQISRSGLNVGTTCHSLMAEDSMSKSHRVIPIAKL
jgi:hypothetical protein